MALVPSVGDSACWPATSRTRCVLSAAAHISGRAVALGLSHGRRSSGGGRWVPKGTSNALHPSSRAATNTLTYDHRNARPPHPRPRPRPRPSPRINVCPEAPTRRVSAQTPYVATEDYRHQSYVHSRQEYDEVSYRLALSDASRCASPAVGRASVHGHAHEGDDAAQMYKRSIDDPEGFWGDIASEFHWETKVQGHADGFAANLVLALAQPRMCTAPGSAAVKFITGLKRCSVAAVNARSSPATAALHFCRCGLV